MLDLLFFSLFYFFFLATDQHLSISWYPYSWRCPAVHTSAFRLPALWTSNSKTIMTLLILSIPLLSKAAAIYSSPDLIAFLSN